MQDALRSAIASRRGSCDWTVDHAGWVVLSLSPDEQTFCRRTLDEGVAGCLVQLMDWGLGVRFPRLTGRFQPLDCTPANY